MDSNEILIALGEGKILEAEDGTRYKFAGGRLLSNTKCMSINSWMSSEDLLEELLNMDLHIYKEPRKLYRRCVKGSYYNKEFLNANTRWFYSKEDFMEDHKTSILQYGPWEEMDEPELSDS
jgi:hypothetical protein